MLLSATSMWGFSVLYFCKLLVFLFFLLGFRTKQDIWRRHLGLWEIITSISHYFLTFYRNDSSRTLMAVSLQQKKEFTVLGGFGGCWILRGPWLQSVSKSCLLSCWQTLCKTTHWITCTYLHIMQIALSYLSVNLYMCVWESSFPNQLTIYRDTLTSLIYVWPTGLCISISGIQLMILCRLPHTE